MNTKYDSRSDIGDGLDLQSNPRLSIDHTQYTYDDAYSPMKQEIYRMDSSLSIDNEWTNIQDVVKTTFRAMHQVIVEQQQSIQNLNHQLKSVNDRLYLGEENSNKKIESLEKIIQKQVQSEIKRIENTFNVHASERDKIAQDCRDLSFKIEQKMDLEDFDQKIEELQRELQFVKSENKQWKNDFEDTILKKIDKQLNDNNKKFHELDSTVETRISNLHTMVHSKPTIQQILKEVDTNLVSPKYEELTIEMNMIRDDFKGKLDVFSKSIEQNSKNINENTNRIEEIHLSIEELENKKQASMNALKADLEKFLEGQQRIIRQELKSQMIQIDNSLQGKINEVKQMVLTEVSSSTSKTYSRVTEEVSNEIQDLKSGLITRTTSEISELKEEVRNEVSLTIKELDILKSRLNDEISDVRSFFLNKFSETRDVYVNRSELKSIFNEKLNDRIGDAVSTLSSQWKNKLDDKVDYLVNYVKDMNDATLSSFNNTLPLYMEKSEVDAIIRTLEESLKASFDLHQQGKRSLVALKESLDAKWEDNQEKFKYIQLELEKIKILQTELDKTKLLQTELENCVKVDELTLLLEKKADVRTLNQWIQQHTQDVNDVLDLKANMEDLIPLREEIKRKVDESSILDLKKEILSLNELKTRVSNLSSQITTDFVEKQALREINHDIIARVDKKVADYSNILAQQIRDITTDLQNKVNRAEVERQLRSFNEKKMNREDILTIKEDFVPIRESISNCVTLQDFRTFTNSVQQELKAISNMKLDASEYNVLATTLKNYLTRREVDTILDSKISSLRRSIDTLHRSIGQLLVTSNSTIQKGEPKIPKTPHIQNSLPSDNFSR